MFKKKQELLFILVSLLLIIFLAVFIFYSINFLFDKTSETIGQDISQTQKNARFNLEGLKKLGIIE